MEFITIDKSGIDFDRYRRYIDSVRSQLPEHVYSFASNPEHFNLESPSSLHDAWLESLIVRERASGERAQIRQLEIQLSLLGPRHDRWIQLRYSGVTQYSFHTADKSSELRFEHTAHGDLIAHEIRVRPSGALVHEVVFERGTTFLIECHNLKYWEEMRVGDDVLRL